VARPEEITIKLLLAVLLAAVIVVSAAVSFLFKGLHGESGESLRYPIAEFKFALGSGIPLSNRMRVDQFANGYALLSSGPVSVQADHYRVLGYSWQPPKMPQEAAFFWRHSDDAKNVTRTEITAAGTHQVDLSTEPDWHGEIIEFGFLLAGVNTEAVEVGNITFIPDSLSTRLQLTWRAWATFEEWSQQSLNFLYGGDHRQIIALPLLIAAWLLITSGLFWLSTRMGKPVSSRQFLTTAGMLFLVAWILLDIRWVSNNLSQIQLSYKSQWQADDQQRSSAALDGDLYRYVQRLKSDVLGKQSARILIIGDENTVDYYLLRAKYHLLPHSANVASRLKKQLTPGSVDYVISFGQPTDITHIPGWGPNWRKSLKQIDQSEWGVVYRSR